jgi:hypothetical protein
VAAIAIDFGGCGSPGDYIFEITSSRIKLRDLAYETGVDRKGALDDADFPKRNAQKAAQKLQRGTFG